ncbi:MAG: DUF159 family protein [Candidatus Cloacimonetes bacterium HGW-Cloacimonetes-3]|jgi:putative SOS response-associated peptidase YedK|nr:MAG: DUF159 family protein [Candidatus Cloacimonetes bacterium HGW-Cloacimonetes-3]
MCGRFAQVIVHTELKKLQDELKLISQSDQMELSFNVAPTQMVSAVVAKGNIRYIGFFRWGLIPSWMKEIPAHAMINIRSETITEKPSFRVSFLRRRCIIPANGFYEWRKQDKQPFFIHAADGDLLYMAGIYDTWESPDGSYVPSLGIITTASDRTIGAIHDRMPLLLSSQTRNVWLNPGIQDIATLSPILAPDFEVKLSMYPVSRKVNSIKNNDAECMQELENASQQTEIFP